MLAKTHPASIDHAAVARELLGKKPVLYEKLAKACEVDEDGAVVLVTEVLRFMNLAAHATEVLGTGLTPSQVVDDAWHEVILCTREYAELCRREFGRFVHHDPGGDEQLNRNRFAETMRLYNLWFGTPDPKWWGKHSNGPVDASCGACQSPANNDQSK